MVGESPVSFHPSHLSCLIQLFVVMLAVSAGILCCLLLLLRRDDLFPHLSALLGGVPKKSAFGAVGDMDLGVYSTLGPTYSQGSDLSYLFKVLYCCFHHGEALTWHLGRGRGQPLPLFPQGTVGCRP